MDATLTSRSDRADLLRSALVDQLPSPRRLANGSVVYTVVLAAPGVLRYGSRSERVTPQALSDAAWLASLEHMPLIGDDGEPHNRDLTVEELDDLRIGTILRAWWDPSIGDEGAALAEVLVDTRAGLALIDSGVTGISVRYHVPLDGLDPSPGVTSDGVPYDVSQIRRERGNHAVVTRRPRDTQAGARADSTHGDTAMEEMIAELVKRMDAMSERFDAYAERMDAMMKGREDADDEGGDMDEPRSDSEWTAKVRADWLAVEKAAKAAGVDLDDGATLADARKAVIAKAAPGRSDSITADGAAALIDFLATQEPKTALGGGTQVSVDPSRTGRADADDGMDDDIDLGEIARSITTARKEA